MNKYSLIKLINNNNNNKSGTGLKKVVHTNWQIYSALRPWVMKDTIHSKYCASWWKYFLLLDVTS